MDRTPGSQRPRRWPIRAPAEIRHPKKPVTKITNFLFPSKQARYPHSPSPQKRGPSLPPAILNSKKSDSPQRSKADEEQHENHSGVQEFRSEQKHLAHRP